MQHILVVDEDTTEPLLIKTALPEEDFSVTHTRSCDKALQVIADRRIDLVVIDVTLPGFAGLKLLETIRSRPDPYVPVILLNSNDCGDELVTQGLMAGADDYMRKPVNIAELRARIRVRLRIAYAIRSKPAPRPQTRNSTSTPCKGVVPLGTGPTRDSFVRTPGMERVFEILDAFSDVTTPILLTGETGTGKGALAHYVHTMGPRRRNSFVQVHCPSVPHDLLTSELFGHERGAFTGAHERRSGRFETAQGGTVFLDEITEMACETQAMLLRFCETGDFERLGSPKTTHVDARLITATNRDLKRAMRDGFFREDLYYRIGVVNVEVPPLRERRDDIPILAQHFLKKRDQERGEPRSRLSDEAVEALRAYAWPGNVRELQNAIERAAVIARERPINARDLGIGAPAPQGSVSSPCGSLPEKLVDAERSSVIDALRRGNGNRTQAARALGIPRTTLITKMRRLKIPD